MSCHKDNVLMGVCGSLFDFIVSSKASFTLYLNTVTFARFLKKIFVRVRNLFNKGTSIKYVPREDKCVQKIFKIMITVGY